MIRSDSNAPESWHSIFLYLHVLFICISKYSLKRSSTNLNGLVWKQMSPRIEPVICCGPCLMRCMPGVMLIIAMSLKKLHNINIINWEPIWFLMDHIWFYLELVPFGHGYVWKTNCSFKNQLESLALRVQQMIISLLCQHWVLDHWCGSHFHVHWTIETSDAEYYRIINVWVSVRHSVIRCTISIVN